MNKMCIIESIVFPVMGISLFLQIWFNSEFSPLFYFSKSTFLFVRLSKFGQYLYLPFHWVFLSWDIEIDRREWAHRSTWYSYILLLLRAHFSFCQLPVLENSLQFWLCFVPNSKSKQTPTPPQTHSRSFSTLWWTEEHQWLLQQVNYIKQWKSSVIFWFLCFLFPIFMFRFDDLFSDWLIGFYYIIFY